MTLSPTIEADIVKRLTGKAHQPQVLVRVIKNNTSNVTVVGEVNNSTLLPLTPKGERLLDALAAGGGVKQPINRVAVQISRDNVTATMPLDLVIRDPRQNILLKPGDVVTALFQPQSFSVLGATGKNEEIPFEAQGISLAQALARSGGLNDSRADARGVFLSDEVMDYMLRRFSRDLGSLMQLLDMLDGFALRNKRAITIPLLKTMLETE